MTSPDGADLSRLAKCVLALPVSKAGIVRKINGLLYSNTVVYSRFMQTEQ